MADTGAPWNIPYAEPSDLVRDWPALSEDVADAVAAGLTAAGNPGIGSNVAYAERLTSFSFSSTSFVDWTNVEVTITPSSNTAKILVILAPGLTTNASGEVSEVIIAKGSTQIGPTGSSATHGPGNNNGVFSTLMVLDSPGSATAQTYRGRVKMTAAGTNGVSGGAIIAIEVAA